MALLKLYPFSYIDFDTIIIPHCLSLDYLLSFSFLFVYFNILAYLYMNTFKETHFFAHMYNVFLSITSK